MSANTVSTHKLVVEGLNVRFVNGQNQAAAPVNTQVQGGEIKVIFPTRRNLERLAQFGSFDEAVRHVEDYPVTMISPFMELRDGERWLSIPADVGYPVTGERLETAARG